MKNVRDQTHFSTRSIKISEIKHGNGRRDVIASKVLLLAQSMKELGLRVPITVRKKKSGRYVLVVGGHRLAAAKKLGWDQIECVVTCAQRDDARRWEIDENLRRSELDALQRAELLVESAQLIAKSTGTSPLIKGGRQPGDKGISQAAKALGINRDKFRRALAIAQIAGAAKKVIRDGGLANNQKCLLAVAREKDRAKQIDRARKLSAIRRKKKSSVSALPLPGAGGSTKTNFSTVTLSLEREWQNTRSLQKAWKRASDQERLRFLKKISPAPFWAQIDPDAAAVWAR